MGYICLKLLDSLGKNYGIYYGINWLNIVGFICKTIGYTGPLNILSKN